MRTFFSVDNFLFYCCMVVLDVAVLSLLWLVCCLPLVTIVPATAALYYSCVKCVRFKQPAPYLNFFQSFLGNLRTGVPVSAAFLVVAWVLYKLYGVLNVMLPDGSGVTAVVIIGFLLFLLFPVGVFSVAYGLLSRFGYTASALIMDAVRLTFKHLPLVAVIAVVNAAAVLFCIKFVYFMPWLVMPAVSTLLVSRKMEPLLRPYTPDLEALMELPEEDRPWYLK